MVPYLRMALVPVLIIAINIPLVMEKIKPNRLYGFRLAKTISNEEIWYKANKFGGYAMIAAGILILIFRVVSIHVPMLRPYDSLGIMIPLILSIVVSMVYVWKL